MFFRPSVPVMLAVPHLQQSKNGECLATCTAMILTYSNHPYPLGQLLKILRIQPEMGAPFSNIVNLEQLGLLVGYQQEGALETLYRLLTHGWPCLIAVDTGELPYWQSSTGHVVVLVGMDGEHVYLNDPALDEAAIQVPIGDFYLAWYEQLLSYAVIAIP